MYSCTSATYTYIPLLLGIRFMNFAIYVVSLYTLDLWHQRQTWCRRCCRCVLTMQMHASTQRDTHSQRENDKQQNLIHAMMEERENVVHNSMGLKLLANHLNMRTHCYCSLKIWWKINKFKKHELWKCFIVTYLSLCALRSSHEWMSCFIVSENFRFKCVL